MSRRSITRPPSVVLWPAELVATAADGELKAIVPGKSDCQRDVLGVGNADDERWMIVDIAAHHDARLLEFGVCGQDYATSELVAQGLDGQPRMYVCCGCIHGTEIVA